MKTRPIGSATFPATMLAIGIAAGAAVADDLVSQPPATGMGVGRSSQLWQDPGPNGNDLDGDAVCFQDFTTASPVSIDRLEWWGSGACELGFRIELWRQDPGTIAYQPIAVFYYGGSAQPPSPEFTFDTSAATVTPGPGGISHYTLRLAQPIAVPANTDANPRWFLSVIGLTAQPFAAWNWAQGFGGSNKTFQFVRGEGPMFRSLGDGRALVIGRAPAPCAADLDGDHFVGAADLASLLAQWGSAGPADLNGSGAVDAADLSSLLGHWGACP